MIAKELVSTDLMETATSNKHWKREGEEVMQKS
jgi:hypothetical protein